MPNNTPSAHASAVLAMPQGHPSAVMAFWFAGSRESGADVQIYSSQFDRSSQSWSPAVVVVNRWQKSGRLRHGLRRLGNPVAWIDRQQRIHLYVVATGWGGWAASRILHLRQVGNLGVEPDKAIEFQTQGLLPLSWLWNISHLVRNSPLPLQDGGMVLPAYFELGMKFPLALRFDAEGDYRGMVRISAQRDLLQPALLPRSPTDWLALMRDSGSDKRIRVAQTRDAGQHWEDRPNLLLRNPDAALATLALAPGQLLLAHNPRENSRAILDLSCSSDGLNWSQLDSIQQDPLGGEHSYPALAWSDNSLWLTFTDQRKSIAWRRYAAPASQEKQSQ